MSQPEVIFVDKNHTTIINRDATSNIVLSQSDKSNVIVTETPAQVIESCKQGPQGPPGNAVGQILNIPAGEVLSQYRVVYASGGKAYHADNTTFNTDDKIIGLVYNDAVLNEMSDVFIAGAIINNNWNFSDGRVFLSTEGQVTQTLPSTGFQIQIGIAVMSNTMILDIDRVIEEHHHDPEYINTDELIDGGGF